jgi:hypothetical protein
MPELRTGWVFFVNERINGCLNAAGRPDRIDTLWWSEIVNRIRSIFISTGPKFQLDPAVQVKLKQLADRTATLQPCILGGKVVKTTTPKGGALRVSAWQYGGMTCVIAINTSNMPVTSTFVLPGMGRAKVATLPWEKKRTVKIAARGAVSDKFAPFSTHLYTVPSPA